LAIVAAVLAADGVFGAAELAGTVLLGELGLDGRVRPVRGVLPGTLAAVGHPGSRQPNPPGISSEAEGSNQYRGWAVRKSVSVVIATLAMVFSVSAPAAAADANDHASCAGLAGASRAGEPGAEAEVVHGVLESGAFPPGLVNFSDFASFHDGSAEACLA